MHYHSFNISRIFYHVVCHIYYSLPSLPIHTYWNIFKTFFFLLMNLFFWYFFFVKKKNQTTNGQMLPLLTTFHRVRLYISDQDTNTAPKLNSKFQFVVSFLVFSVYNFHPRTRKASSIRAKFMWLVSFSIILNLTFYFYNILIIK